MFPKSVINFPDPRHTDKDGLLCWGGNLEVPTLLQAYSLGIFPWYNENSPILWWSPPKRMVIKPHELITSKSLRAAIRKQNYEVKFDTDFAEIIRNCANANRKEQDSTWITNDMQEAYISLHKAGFAHSAGTYTNGELVGGLYGVSLGRAFFGESMFYKESNASKIAFFHLVEKLKSLDFQLIDCQQNTTHLKSFGAYEVERDIFLNLLRQALTYKSMRGSWNKL